MRDYLNLLYSAVPTYIYEMLLSLLCIAVVVLATWKGKHSLIYISRVLTGELIFFIYCSTVIFREECPEREIKLDLFWSYDFPELLYENVMNVVIFVVLGFLMGLSCKAFTWWQTLLFGLLTSTSIETLQFISKRGTCDVDDVIHNTVGCLIGYVFFAICSLTVGKMCINNKE